MSDLTIRPHAGVQLTSIDDVARVSRMFAESGFFTDAREAAQCGVKIMAGAAWGIDPFSAMVGIHIIKNKPSVSAGLMAAAVKGHPRYDYRVRERTATVCRIEFFEGAESLGISEYTMKMAERAGLTGSDMYRKYPEAMLFSRCMSSGARTYCPDVLGPSVYTPEELGAAVDEEGNYVEVVARAERPVEARALPAAAPEPAPEPEAVPEAPEAVEDAATAKQLAALGATVKKQGLTPEQTRAFLGWLLERPIASAKDLTKAEASRVLGWDDDAWSDALADYAVVTAGGPPEDEPDFSGITLPAGDVPVFDPNGNANRRAKREVAS